MQGKWTDEENFIFLQYITTHPSVFEENIEMAMNVEELTRNINSTMMEMGIIKSGLGHLKTENQVKIKIKNLKKKKELLFRLVEDDI